MGLSTGFTCAAARLAFAVVLLCCCSCNTVTINMTHEALELEVIDLRRNLTQVWEQLGDTQDRLERLEEQLEQRCGGSSGQQSSLDSNPTSGTDSWSTDGPEKWSRERDHEDQEEPDDEEEDDDDRKSGTKGERKEEDGDDRRERKSGRPWSERQDGRGGNGDKKRKDHKHSDHHRDDDRQNGQQRSQSTGSGCSHSGMTERGYNKGKNGTQQAGSNAHVNITAYCSMRPNKATPPDKRVDIRGRIYLSQENGSSLTMNIKVSGFKQPVNGTTELLHGFHAHEYGNLTNGCESAGSHYNPLNATHGAHPDNSTGPEDRHVGDFGNIMSDAHGNVNETLIFNITNALSGEHSLIGKTLVIHENEDDLGVNTNDTGSITTGNSGPRLACCIIYKLN